MNENSQQVKIPKVFISYAWAGEIHVDNVLNLANRLMADGVAVVIDKWDLKEGQDKYRFMEQCVNDPDIDKVLIICDKIYTDKANDRLGGVGDETAIISSEVYGRANQEKFIPVIFEKDETGKAYCPVYLKARIYIDLSYDNQEFENEYEKLLRNIWKAPQYLKPQVGKKPEWLEKSSTNLSRLKDLIKQYKYTVDPSRHKFIIRNIFKEFFDRSNDFHITEVATGELIVQRISKMKQLRDALLDFIEIRIEFGGGSFGVDLANYFEELHNNLLITDNTESRVGDTEHYKYLIWELFICTTALLFNFKEYQALHDLLVHTYFLNTRSYDSSYVEPQTFVYFRQYFQKIEQEYKPKSDKPTLFTMTGEILMNREKLPTLTKPKIVYADILLCQLSFIFEKTKYYGSGWFPDTYVYSNEDNNYWVRLKSKSFCREVFPLFGCTTIDELKKLISEHPIAEKMRYNGSFRSCPGILDNMCVDDIGSMY